MTLRTLSLNRVPETQWHLQELASIQKCAVPIEELGLFPPWEGSGRFSTELWPTRGVTDTGQDHSVLDSAFFPIDALSHTISTTRGETTREIDIEPVTACCDVSNSDWTWVPEIGIIVLEHQTLCVEEPCEPTVFRFAIRADMREDKTTTHGVFAYLQHADGSIVAICLKCHANAATANTLSKLALLETQHRCDKGGAVNTSSTTGVGRPHVAGS
jgi:hypothetical protein